MEKRLVRKDNKILGVCGGLGYYFGIDPTMVRILFVIGAIVFGSGFIIYLALALIMPAEKQV